MFLIGSAISFLISIGCLVAGVRALILQRRRQERSKLASGVVVALQKQIFNPGTSGVYCPTIEFTTASGDIVRFESSYGTMPASQKVGQVVKVRYDPKKPDSAEIDSGLSNWLVPGCLLIFAIGAFFFSIMFFGLYFIFPNGS
jgi:Protein of unknown function (DUF3592)